MTPSKLQIWQYCTSSYSYIHSTGSLTRLWGNAAASSKLLVDRNDTDDIIKGVTKAKGFHSSKQLTVAFGFLPTYWSETMCMNLHQDWVRIMVVLLTKIYFHYNHQHHMYNITYKHILKIFKALNVCRQQHHRPHSMYILNQYISPSNQRNLLYDQSIFYPVSSVHIPVFNTLTNQNKGNWNPPQSLIPLVRKLLLVRISTVYLIQKQFCYKGILHSS